MGVVRRRIMLLLCAVAVLFLLGIAGWQSQEQRRLGLLYKQTSLETCRTVDKLVDLRGGKLATLASDYTYWDEMVDFVKKPDPKWAEINLVTGMATFGADAIVVYNPSSVKVYSTDSSGKPSLLLPDFRPEQIKRLFSAGPLCHFFLQTRSGLLEVRGAKIVPSADSKRTGPTRGYFLASQIWDSSYLDEVASLIDGKASLQPVSDSSRMMPGERKQSVIVFRKLLRGPDGRSLQTLCITKRFDQGDIQRAASRTTIILLGLFAGMMIVVLALGLSRFVARPLGLIASAMETQSPDSLSTLEKDPSEFGRLAKLVREFFGQRADLENRREALVQANAEIEDMNRQLVDALAQAHQLANVAEQAKKETEEHAIKLSHQATHDALTGLPNRHCFEQHLGEIIKSASGKESRSMAVLFIDLDNFKMVNDTMGHESGDMLLVETAVRLSSCLRQGDTLARMGGDEFAVLLNDIRSKDAPAMIAGRMLEQVSLPFEINGSKLVVGTSIGVSIYPDNATDVVGLLRSADAAMYKAKTLGRNNCHFFSEELNEANLARAQMEIDLRLAIERDEIKVYYQPIVDVKTMEIAGAEALLRWDHPEKGMISPSLFIPIAEETGLILEMGKMVLETACWQCKSWHDMGYADFEMSVNVSPAQLNDIGFISEVDKTLLEAGLGTRFLKLEVTERVLAKNDNDELDILSILKSLGVSISLDDFGVGYSSLSRLSNLPISHVKIDGYFTSHCDHNQKDRAMTESIIVMAHNLGMRVTAEWVEDERQMATIRSLGCDYAQGYLVSPALSSQAFEDFIDKWKLAHRTADAA